MMLETVLIAALLLPGTGTLAVETPVADAELLTLTPKMAKFLVDNIDPGQVRKLRLRRLLDVIFAEDGLGISYGNNYTKTAAETFETRSGNCLSFTFLFVAMARHLGLKAYFSEVAEVLSWHQRGDIVVSNKHMFAEVEIDNDTVQVDFLPGEEKRYRTARRISDRRALAHYYNNLGADKLTAGDPAGALAVLAKALTADDTLSPALVNQGFAYRRLGRFQDAEHSYLRALELAPREHSAASNLVGLYLALGRPEDAEPYLRRVESHQQRNPFHHFRLGRQSAAAGDYQAAVEHFKQAIRRFPDDAGFHASLAEAYLRIGAPAKARASLRRALRLAPDEARKTEIEGQLSAL